jgi:prepilin peptidase CpaA
MTFLTLSFQTLYLICVAYAILSDIRQLMIPNWVPAVLVAAFLPYTVALWPDVDLLPRLAFTAGAFLLSLWFYQLHWFGGGDVKFLTAISLWMGPIHIASFGILMAILGSLLAMFILALRQAVNVYHVVAVDRLPNIVRRWIEEGVCPYGIAIGIAALIMGPRIFP